MQKTFLISFIILFALSACENNEQSQADAGPIQCLDDEQIKEGIQAQYQFSDAEANYAIFLERNQAFVVHSIPEQQLIKAWKRERGEKASHIIAYQNFKRGMFYEAADLQKEQLINDWPEVQNIVSFKPMREALTKTEDTELGCYQVEHYHGEYQQMLVSLSWIPDLNLLVEFSEQTIETAATESKTETKEETKEKSAQVSEAVIKRHYQLTALDSGSLKPTLNNVLNYDLIDYLPVTASDSNAFLQKIYNYQLASKQP